MLRLSVLPLSLRSKFPSLGGVVRSTGVVLPPLRLHSLRNYYHKATNRIQNPLPLWGERARVRGASFPCGCQSCCYHCGQNSPPLEGWCVASGWSFLRSGFIPSKSKPQEPSLWLKLSKRLFFVRLACYNASNDLPPWVSYFDR